MAAALGSRLPGPGQRIGLLGGSFNPAHAGHREISTAALRRLNLDAILTVGVVDGLEAALAHIDRHGSHHTEAILTEDASAAETFLKQVDAAIVMHNTSTQFADGGEFGMGAEIGISTGRLHARGPVGAEQLTSYKYVVRGKGQVRP